MRTQTVLLGAGVLGTAVAAVAMGPVPTSGSGARATIAESGETGEARLRGGLAATLETAGADELIPITIVLRDQVARAELDQLTRVVDRAERRAAVVERLRTRTAASNAELLRALELEQDRGRVGARLRALWISNVVATEATPDVVRRVAARADVAYVGPDRQIGAEVFPVQPAIDFDPAGPLGGGTLECGVEEMRADEVWQTYGFDGDGVVVGIIDTGACLTHPDLANQIWNNADEIPGNGLDDDNNGYVDDTVGWNFRDQTNDVSDTNGHGTHTAGTVCGDGTGGDQTGMAPGVELMILKFWNSFSGESVVWEATQYAVANDADIITASIGWPHSVGPDRVRWREVCENAIAAGVTVIYAAGNEGGCCPPDNVRTPGDVPDMITIGATDCSQVIAGFSSRGPVTWQGIPPWNDWPYPPGKIKPTVSAPGVDTLSTRICTGYTRLSGTSMATPHVAGAAALVLQANPALDHFGVKDVLMQTAIDRGPEGMDNDYGAGFVDAFAAVELALESSTPGDANGDGIVDFRDLLYVIGNWGPCPPQGECPGDVDGSGTVDFEDINLVLANWS